MRHLINKVYLLVITLFLSGPGFSQHIISLHPVIGDTITQSEAFDFYLFQDSAIGKFDYALIYKENNDRYRVMFYGDSISELIIDSLQVDEYAQNIEKLNQYLMSKNNGNRDLVVKQPDSLLIQSVDLNLMTPEKKKKMVKDARAYTLKKLMADEKCLIGSEREDFINYTGAAVWSSKKKDKKKKKKNKR